ncbi:hypothetical protein IV203_002599 [Nitzschia inconspicua]|uniref:Uncharacterized protein n=1 Tax=Nitzschia inconspicua TaxID=303405 RepID=A0A9K3K6T4_9STRA|nr:hypothetical protein IV203_002599 [Nitzschia inconspicua]
MATVNTPSAAIPATPTMDSPSVEKQSSPMVEKLEHVPRRSRTPSTSSCSSVLFQFEIPGSKPNTKSPLDQDDDVAWMDDFLCPTQRQRATFVFVWDTPSSTAVVVPSVSFQMNR